MVAPLIAAAAIGGVAKLGAALLGNSAQKKQLKLQQQQIDNENNIAQDQLEFAKTLNKQGLATQVDAHGNVSYYDEKTNTWQTVLTPQQKALQEGSDREQYNQYNVDAPLARAEALRQASTRSQEGDTATSLRGQLNSQLGKPAYNADQIASSLRLSRERAVNAGYDDVTRAANTMNTRTGATGTAGAMERLAKARSNQIAQTMGAPDLEGQQAALDMNNSKTSGLVNNYSAMAARAAGNSGYNFNPSNAADSLTAAMTNQRANAAALGSAAQNGVNGAARTISGVPVPGVIDYSNTFASLANSGSDLYKAILASKTPKVDSNQELDRRLGNELG